MEVVSAICWASSSSSSGVRSGLGGGGVELGYGGVLGPRSKLSAPWARVSMKLVVEDCDESHASSSHGGSSVGADEGALVGVDWKDGACSAMARSTRKAATESAIGECAFSAFHFGEAGGGALRSFQTGSARDASKSVSVWLEDTARTCPRGNARAGVT